jgi:hypothetical protein
MSICFDLLWNSGFSDSLMAPLLSSYITGVGSWKSRFRASLIYLIILFRYRASFIASVRAIYSAL